MAVALGNFGDAMYPQSGGMFELQASVARATGFLRVVMGERSADVFRRVDPVIAALNWRDRGAYLDGIRVERVRKVLLALFRGRPLRRETEFTGNLEPEASYVRMAVDGFADGLGTVDSCRLHRGTDDGLPPVAIPAAGPTARRNLRARLSQLARAA